MTATVVSFGLSRGPVQKKPEPAPSSEPYVLVIEDHPGFRVLIQCVLEGEGVTVETAEDGAEGLAWARARRPSVVILDLNLPVLDGEIVARELRATYGPSLPLVLVSSSDRIQAVARRVGANGWLAKPFTIDALVTTVQHALSSAVISG